MRSREMLPRRSDAEDALQEVFLVVHRRLHEYRGHAKISTWLHEITFRVTQNQRRKQRIRRWLPIAPSMDDMVWQPLVPAPIGFTQAAV